MPFGKYRGVEIEDLPSDYLDWLTTIDLHGRLKQAVMNECRMRFQGEAEEKESPARPPSQFDEQDRALLAEILRAGYRALALKYHPDLETGNAEIMVRLNRLMDRFRGSL